MGPIFDKLGLCREKLAFLIHSCSGPLVILIPLSSWFATINIYLEYAGVNHVPSSNTKIIADPFLMQLQTLPFIFYSFLLLFSVCIIICQQLSFGPMTYFENRTKTTYKTQGNTLEIKGTIYDLLVPFATILGIVLIGIPYCGGYSLFGGGNTLLESFQHNNYTFIILGTGGMCAVITGVVFGYMRKVITTKQIYRLIPQGLTLMGSPIVMVTLASILGLLLREDLHTGSYLASTLLRNIPVSLLPVSFFFVSCIIAIFTGSSWGTFALMLSIAVPMVTALFNITTPASTDQVPFLFPILGAIFSGGICGDHLSPISETTIMTATSTQTDPFDHCISQLPYALPAVISSALSFVCAGYLQNYPLWLNTLLSLITGLVACIILIYCINLFSKKKKNYPINS